MSTHTKEEFTSLIDGQPVVAAWRAFSEPGKPFCLRVHLADRNLYATLQPTEVDGEVVVHAAEAAEYDRHTAISWVEGLTELVEKARAWDQMMADLDDLDDQEDDQEDQAGQGVTVDYLDVVANEDGSIWADIDGDMYAIIDGTWHTWAVGVATKWEPIDPDELTRALEGYGPYRLVNGIGAAAS